MTLYCCQHRVTLAVLACHFCVALLLVLLIHVPSSSPLQQPSHHICDVYIFRAHRVSPTVQQRTDLPVHVADRLLVQCYARRLLHGSGLRPLLAAATRA